MEPPTAVAIAGMTLALVGCSTTAPMPDVESVRQTLAANWANMADRIKAGDLDGYLRYWTPDLRLLSDPGFEDVRGRDGYRTLAEVALETVTVVEFSVHADEVSVHDAETAVDLGEWAETYAFAGSSDTWRALSSAESDGNVTKAWGTGIVAGQ